MDTVATVDMRDEYQLLSEEEKNEVAEVARSIDLTNSTSIMNYGTASQKKISSFAEKTLDSVRTKDMDEVGDMVTELINQLKDFDVEENEKGLRALFRKSANKLESLKTQYSAVESNVETITSELEKHQVTLMKDVELLDRMYEANLENYKELSRYIMAGTMRLDEIRNGELLTLQKKAEESGLPEDAQAARDLASQCDRLEKKIHDLELTKTIALQTAPQIRMVQLSDTQMAEKIQSTIVNTIPLWKSQMVIALGVNHASDAARAEREVSDMTNELLKKNADKLKMATIESAKEAERGIVDIETLKHTNEQLISTLDEVAKIQKEGKEKRIQAESELQMIEEELSKKLIEASK